MEEEKPHQVEIDQKPDVILPDIRDDNDHNKDTHILIKSK